MSEQTGPTYWERFNKVSVFTGGLSFLMVYFSAALNGRFDWTVFSLSGLAVILSWLRASLLVPAHKRHEHAEEEMWRRYAAGNWKYVDALSELSGAEIDALRDIFRRGNDSEVRSFIDAHWPSFSGEEVQGFLHFFNEDFGGEFWAYIDEDGRLQSVDN